MLNVSNGAYIALLPYPGIPHNAHSAKRIAGDLPDLIPAIKATKANSEAIFSITTQKLGSPIAQLLLPGNCMIILSDPYEIEDILNRRIKEFDKSAWSLSVVGPLFSKATLAQLTTPELKAQKRLWADVMGLDFLKRTAAPKSCSSTLELIDLWRLKATTAYRGQPFNVLEDLKNAALDAVWVSIIGEESGTLRYERIKLEHETKGQPFNEPAPPGSFMKEQVAYIVDTIMNASATPFPTWAIKFEVMKPRFRRFRKIVTQEMSRAMKKAMMRYEGLDLDRLQQDTIDTCAMDLVLRKQALQAKKAGVEPSDPTKDVAMLDEMFVLLIGGHDSTANTLAWFIKFMEAFPHAQTELRTTLRSVFGPGVPTLAQILETDIPYLDAACEEALRLSGTSNAILRSPVQDTTILGYPVSKGSIIYMNTHVNRSPAPVDESQRSDTSRAARERKGDGFQTPAGRDLGHFEPRRWLIIDEATGKERFNPNALPQLAFAGGVRMCFGKRMAVMQFRIAVTLLVLSFEFQEVREEMQSMACIERLFRTPQQPYAKLRVL
ncbi:putative cytochrome P450 E-class, group IV [Cercophora samala]|uniref:Cytochrome P450 E-class, group IV n=1 Tax=Cercophora samala TaxID=330535 RepID=A0AA40D0V7_9PEZI|nr:putative cytochrome P450 E-class, group IV [Cercophora samala]